MMKEIEKVFNETFSNWNISLPPEAVAGRQRGKVVQSGWAIWYLFGSDENGEYLDYYAGHRMTNDRHVRIYADGRCEPLPAIHDMRLASEDPEEDARLESEYYQHNQQVAQLLEAKGFRLHGDEPGGVQINRLLHTEELDQEKH